MSPASLPVRPSSLLLPFLSSRVSGPEGGLGHLSPRVCDWSGVYFFSSAGLMIAVLLPRVSSTWSPKCMTLGSTSYRGEQPGVGGRRGRHWRLQGEGPMGRCLPG